MAVSTLGDDEHRPDQDGVFATPENATRIRPNSTNRLPGIDQDRARMGQHWPDIGQLWPEFDEMWPGDRPNLGRTRPNLAQIRPSVCHRGATQILGRQLSRVVCRDLRNMHPRHALSWLHLRTCAARVLVHVDVPVAVAVQMHRLVRPDPRRATTARRSSPKARVTPSCLRRRPAPCTSRSHRQRGGCGLKALSWGSEMPADASQLGAVPMLANPPLAASRGSVSFAHPDFRQLKSIPWACPERQLNRITSRWRLTKEAF